MKYLAFIMVMCIAILFINGCQSNKDVQENYDHNSDTYVNNVIYYKDRRTDTCYITDGRGYPLTYVPCDKVVGYIYKE